MSGFVGKIVMATGAAAFLVWCTSVAFKSMGSGPEAIFEALLGNPDEVSELDGFVRTGDGYDVQIRFIAEDDWIRAIPYKGFRETTCETVRTKVRFSLMRVAIWPPWRPEDLGDATCYRRNGRNELSASGRDVMLVDRDTGWVYFAGEGREHDKALPSSDRLYQ